MTRAFLGCAAVLVLAMAAATGPAAAQFPPPPAPATPVPLAKAPPAADCQGRVRIRDQRDGLWPSERAGCSITVQPEPNPSDGYLVAGK
ncbi:MAG: hypothetical protein WBW73_25520, partial [Rhodoplanes sp.]